MAKRSNNVRSKTSDASRPYDVSNSFVKRMASRMTELLPQPSSWLSRWMSPESASSMNDFASHSLSSTITSRPPATSRAELNLVEDIDHHIPAKKPRTSRYSSPVNQNKFLRSEVCSAGDISPIVGRGEPVAGPSTSHNTEFIASTPASHGQEQNLTKVNGDDCSETSESTSGCSSLVPQAQSASRSLGGSRYGRTLPATAKVDSLHERRPSFSTTTFASPLRASMRDRMGSSPFYSGRTMYGGSSQAYLSTIHSPQRRIGPTVKPMPAQQTLPLSSTAKRILDALEQFSTPVMDAKRMPVVGSKRKMESGSQRYMELSVPSTPDLLRVKRRERLQQSTSAARQTATATESNLELPAEYIMRSENSETKKHTGKVKTKEKIGIETLVNVKLPSVALAVDNLPRIDIPVPPRSHVQTVASSQSSPTTNKFMFSSPTAVSHSGTVVVPTTIPSALFKFSVPTGETNNKISASVDINRPVFSLSRTSSDIATSHQKRHTSKDDCSDELVGNIVESAKNTVNNSVVGSSFNLYSSANSVAVQPDVKSVCKQCSVKIENPNTSCPSCHKAQSKNAADGKNLVVASQWECPSCKKKNSLNYESCIGCQTKRYYKSVDPTKNNVKSTSVTDFVHFYKKPLGTWECPTCMIQNKNDALKCIACETSKPPIKKKSSSPMASGVDDQLKKTSESGESKTSVETSTQNTSLSCQPIATSTKPIGNGFGNMFKKAPGSWVCEVCMITNNADKINCLACNSVKPGAQTSASDTSKFSFGMPTTAATTVGPTFSFGVNKGDQPVSTQGSSFVTKTSASTQSVLSETPMQTQSFSFGVPQTLKTGSDNSISVTSSTLTKGAFQFGIPSSQISVTESKLSSENATASKQNIPENLLQVGTSSKTVAETKGKEDTRVEPPKSEVNITSNSMTSSILTSATSPGITSVASTFGGKNETSVTVGPEKNSTPLFSFGTNKTVQNENDKQDNSNSFSSTPLQATFTFGAKQGSFGSDIASSTTSTLSSSSSNIFQFGETKTVPSSADMSSISSVNTQPNFTHAKANNIFTFGSNAEKKDVTFGSTVVKEVVLPSSTMAVNETKPTFGSFGAVPTPTSAFGNVNTFGNAAFGSKEQPPNPFIPQTTSNIFGTTETTNASTTSTFSGFGQTNAFPSAQENKPSAVFTFGSLPPKEPAASGGFVFNPGPEKRTETAFGFRSAQTSSTGQAFGFNATSSNPSASYNFGSPFNAATDSPAPVFGSTSSQQPTPAFGEQTNPNQVFAFGSQTAQPSQTPTNNVFEFTPNQQQSAPVAPAPSTTFVFGANPTAPAAPSFDPNIRPTFNFTQGGTPPVFSAVSGTPQPVRKIRKAVRRTNISSVRQT